MGSSASISSSSSKRTFVRSGEQYMISTLTEDELNDKVKEIIRIKIPFFDDDNLQTILHIVILLEMLLSMKD